MKVDWCVLTNFEKLRLYYTHLKKPNEGLIYELDYKDFLSDKGLKYLWDLTKERIKNNSLETYRLKKTREDINTEIVNDLYEIRKSLINEISKKNKINNKLLGESVQRLLDRLVIIRTAEDRGIIGSESLNMTLTYWLSFSVMMEINLFLSRLIIISLLLF